MYRVFYPLLVINNTFVEVVEVEITFGLRTNLERAALELLNAPATVSFDELFQLLRLLRIGQKEH